jgi:hypothetical protein
MDWSDLEKNIAEFNSMFKATSMGDPRKPDRGYVTGRHGSLEPSSHGVHSPATHELHAEGDKAGVHAEHKRVISQMRSMPKPKLPA